jgi:ribonuclease BN (tRNA processing enzyme)
VDDTEQPDPRSSAPTVPRLTIVGSGTMRPDHRRHSAGHYLEHGDTRILLDCGPGILHSMERFQLPWADLTHLAITHFHTDHIGDLPGLFFALKHGLKPERTRPLVVLGPRGLYRRFGSMAGAFGDHFVDPGFGLILVELKGGERWTPPEGGFTMACHRTPHTDGSLAYRWEGEGLTVGYTGDTGPSEELGPFLAGCDAVISECAFSDPPPDGAHLSPASVAALARVAEPRLLLLTHVYAPQIPEDAARSVGEHGWPGRVEAARDGTTVRFREGAMRVDHPGTQG